MANEAIRPILDHSLAGLDIDHNAEVLSQDAERMPAEAYPCQRYDDSHPKQEQAIPTDGKVRSRRRYEIRQCDDPPDSHNENNPRITIIDRCNRACPLEEGSGYLGQEPNHMAPSIIAASSRFLAMSGNINPTFILFVTCSRALPLQSLPPCAGMVSAIPRLWHADWQQSLRRSQSQKAMHGTHCCVPCMASSSSLRLFVCEAA